MPQNIDASIDSTRHEGDADWQRWEQTFRDARPVLPDAAMARIEASLNREAERVASAPPAQPRRVILWFAILLLAGTAAVAALNYAKSLNHPNSVNVAPGLAPRVHDTYALDLPVEPTELPAHPPEFGPRTLTQAVVEARSKSVQEGVATYHGSVILSAGPWTIACDRLAAFRGPTHGALLNGTGNVHIHGISGLNEITSDEVTFDTETGNMKLAGHVHMTFTNKTADLKACTITRLAEVRDSQP